MSRQIYVNLPVSNIPRSITFFESLGYDFDPVFTDEKGACMVVNENIFVMFVEEGAFSSFTNKQVADARKSTGVIVCLTVENRDEVDTLVAKAVAAGGTSPLPPNDHGFMYQHGFQDLDGHVWEIAHIDPDAATDLDDDDDLDDQNAED